MDLRGALVGRQIAYGDARRADFVRHPCGAFTVATMDDDMGAFIGQHARNRFADAAAAAGDERAPTLELQIHAGS